MWSLPRRALVLLFGVELGAVACITADLIGGAHEFDSGQVAAAGILVASSIVHAELSLGAERLRRRISETRYVDLSSAWTFAAALALPPLLAVAAVMVSYVHLYIRAFRPGGTLPHRQVYSTSTVVLAVYLVALVQTAFGDQGFGTTLGVVSLAASTIVYTAVNTVLVVSVICLCRPGSSFVQILAGGESGLELATLCLGALVAGAVLPGPWPLLILVLPTLVLLEQTTLIRQLEKRARTDAKTGLLNPDAWRAQATAIVSNARRHSTLSAVLILDLDHFKSVNDRYGHLTGDAVLGAVADVVVAQLRDGDAIGRFGGEEFVVALESVRHDDDTGDGAPAVLEVCERIRRCICELSVQPPGGPGEPLTGLTASIGAARYPIDGTAVSELLAVADSALYVAKNSGRNRVHLPGGVSQRPAAS